MKGVSSEYVDVVGEQMFGGECSSVKEDTGDKAMKETKVNVTTDRTASISLCYLRVVYVFSVFILVK